VVVCVFGIGANCSNNSSSSNNTLIFIRYVQTLLFFGK